MRTRRVLIAVTALIACLAIGSPTVATAKPKPKKVATTISLAVAVKPPNPYAPYQPGSGTFSGQVKAKGPSGCKKGRTVTISRDNVAVGTAITQSNGSYSLTIQTAPAAGTYTASVPKEVITQGKTGGKKGKPKKKKFICSAAVSPPVVVP